MSTLQVDSINSFTPSDPVTINDSFKVTGSSTFTGSVGVLAGNGEITLSSNKPVSISTAGIEVASGITGSNGLVISASTGVTAAIITGSTNLEGATTVGTANNPQNLTVKGNTFVSGNLQVTGSTHNLTGTVGVLGNTTLTGNITTTGNSEIGNSITDIHAFTGSYISLSGSKAMVFKASSSGDLNATGKVNFGEFPSHNHKFTGSVAVTSSMHFKVTSVSSSFINLPKANTALNSFSHTLTAGELFTVSGSQLPFSGSAGELDAVSASLFVMIKA